MTKRLRRGEGRVSRTLMSDALEMWADDPGTEKNKMREKSDASDF